MLNVRGSALRLLLSFVLSLMVWMFVSLSQDRNATYNSIPVEVEQLEPDVVIIDEEGLPKNSQTFLDPINMVLRTDEATLADIDNRDLYAYVNLFGLRKGTHLVDIQPGAHRYEPRISFVSLEPEKIEVRLDNIITQTVPITINLQGDLPFGFERDEPVVRVNGEPVDQVQVSGPANQVETVVVALAAANIDQRQSSYSGALQLEPFDTNGQSVEGVTVLPSSVNVHIPIRSEVGLRRVPVLGNVTGIPASGFIISNVISLPSLINLSGSSRRLDQIDHIETEEIDITGMSETFTREVRLMFPSGTSSQNDDDLTALVNIAIVPQQVQFQANLLYTVQITGTPPGLEVTYTPMVVTVSLEGSSFALQQMSQSNLTAFVDIEGLLPGNYTLTPTLQLPPGITTVGDLPQIDVAIRLPATATPQPTSIRLETVTATAEPIVESTATISTVTPSESPSPFPTDVPTIPPSINSAQVPTASPTDVPTISPSADPTQVPTATVVPQTPVTTPDASVTPIEPTATPPSSPALLPQGAKGDRAIPANGSSLGSILLCTPYR
ncbi:MAG: hypothetical protein HC837_07980 [Chloroflexaceae bacterium]|nr:hypothetical protein [Chloroflexaceae bacterium]